MGFVLGFVISPFKVKILVYALIAILSLFLIIKVINNDKNENNNYLKIIGLIVVLLLTFLSKGDFCYLGLIIFIAYISGLLSKEFINTCSQLFGNLSLVQLSINSPDPKREENIENDGKTLEQNSTLSRKEIVKKYNTIEQKVFDYFKQEKHINFQKDVMLSNKKFAPIYADGVCQTQDKNIYIEIKYGFGGEVLKRGIENLLKINERLNKSINKVELIFALVVSNCTEEQKNRIIEIYQKNYGYITNLKFSLFSEENDELKLMYFEEYIQ